MNIRIRPVRIELPNRLSANYLTNRQLRPYVNAALSSLVLNYIVTDTVYFNFEPLIKRPLTLSLDTVHTFLASGYSLENPVSIQPHKVVVTGPVSLIKALPDPFPVHIPDSMLKQRYEKQIPLAFIPQELVKSKTKQVKVVFNVKPIPFQEADVPVQFQGENPYVFPGGPPTFVKLRYQLAVPSTTPIITGDSFEIVADISKVDLRDSTVAVVVRKKPRLVKTVSVLPQKVKVLLRNR